MERCTLGGLPGVGANLLEIGNALKIAALLCIP